MTSPETLRIRAFVAGAVVGATFARLLDPAAGRRRRRLLVDRAVAAVRRSRRATARGIRIGGLRAVGRAKGFVHGFVPAEKEPPDDVTLAHKVESIVFRDSKVPKGRISVNAERGKVFLRGQVDEPELIHELEEAVRKVAGVRGVENLLHLPETSAPAIPPKDIHAR
jgi:hypothetical protein